MRSRRSSREVLFLLSAAGSWQSGRPALLLLYYTTATVDVVLQNLVRDGFGLKKNVHFWEP